MRSITERLQREHVSSEVTRPPAPDDRLPRSCAVAGGFASSSWHLVRRRCLLKRQIQANPNPYPNSDLTLTLTLTLTLALTPLKTWCQAALVMRLVALSVGTPQCSNVSSNVTTPAPWAVTAAVSAAYGSDTTEFVFLTSMASFIDFVCVCACARRARCSV
jgi:hypothetical protein